MTELRLEVHGRGKVVVDVQRLVIAGFTGRDENAVRRHIDELVDAGVPAPDRVPEFYDLPAELLTTSGEIEVSGASTSGEIEPVVFVTSAGTFVGVGSDHTDREQEKKSILAAKAACPKVTSTRVVPLEDVDDRWDALKLRSVAGDGHLYQQGTLDELLPISDLLRRVPSADDLVLFCGTIPLVDGFRFADRFEGELIDRDGRVLSSYGYRVVRRK